MSIELSPLPYATNALEPHISKRTLEIHYGKHHKAYIDKLNALIAETDYDDMSLRRIVETSAYDPKEQLLFNNAAQAWNHAFYWRSLHPKGGKTPHGELAEWIISDFGGYDAFARQFRETATGQFGSGWAWLVINKGRLVISRTSNADTPIINGQIPLLAIDVWEHAYYLDYQNRRPEYVDVFLKHLANWDFAEQNIPKEPNNPHFLDRYAQIVQTSVGL